MSELYERLSKLSPKRLALLAMEMQERLDVVERNRNEPIAIIGMGCRLPGAVDPAAYWQLLVDGVDAIREIPPSRWDVDEYYDPDPDAPGKIATRWAGTLDGIEQFEPQMFGIAPREARTMDPQQRLLLEVAWETLEHAGIAPDALHCSATGVYVGLCNADYAQLQMEGDEADFDMYLSTGNAGSIASGRLSYVLGLQGPAITVDTACSSSLVAVHLAVQALRSDACRMALAGGVNVILSPKTTMTLSRARMMAADGRCKSFDARADGFVRGEGCGLVALKRLSDAQADGDRVLAVIRGSAINQDGRSNGLTAPNGPAQVAVIRAALADAGVDPTAVGYVETHGTGTALGDPIEAQALGAAFGAGRDASNRLMIGTAKANLGHLESAAGIAGLIKVVLSLQHGEIPPLLHLTEPNPFIPWSELPIDVPTVRTPWSSPGGRRIGGVSLFGFSGTNVHVLLEEAPVDTVPGVADSAAQRTSHLLKLSARTDTALQALASRVGEALSNAPAGSMVDIARTANGGRSDLAHRLAVIATHAGEAGSALSAWAAGQPVDGLVAGGPVGLRPPEVAFLFTGHGSQYAGMGRALYADDEVFREAIDQCGTLLAPLMAQPLTTVLFDEVMSESLLASMAFAQPAVFAVEYALAQMWQSWGVRPSVVAGHSVGEYVAAVVAGVMSLDDGIKLVAARGRLMASLPADGEMATVFASEERVNAMLGAGAGSVSIAAVNGPQSVALSGTGGRLQPVLDQLRADGIEVRPLSIPIAAHSPQVEPILDEFEAVAAGVQFHDPRIDVISGMTGALATGDDLVTAQYWRRHLRLPVRFADAFRSIHDRGVRTFVEVGPHPSLLNMARHIVPEHECAWLPSLRSGHDEWQQMLSSAARLYVAGAALEWRAVDASGGSVVTLPTYPFERERYWADAAHRHRARAHSGGHPLLGSRVQSPALRDTVFENALGVTWPAFLDHHRIYGTALLPSPAYLEMALAAGAATAGAADGHGVEAFEIREALILPDEGERIVQLVMHEERDEADPSSTVLHSGRRFEVFSRAPDLEEWTLHATGRLVPLVGAPAGSLDPDDVRSRCPEHIDGTAYYERLAAHGLEFGTGFRGVTDVWRRDGEALGRVALPPALLAESTRFGIHPALLDACFHVLGAPMMASTEHAHLLVGIDEFRLHARPGPWVWNHTALRPGFEQPGGTCTGDIRLYDEHGTLIAEALGLHLRYASREALMRATRRAANDWVYEVAWQLATDVIETPGDEQWIVVGGAELGAAVAAELEARSIVNVQVDDADTGALQRALSATGVGRRRVVYVGGVAAAGDPTATTTAAVAIAQSIIHGDRDGELWLVTRAAQPAAEVSVDPRQAPLWGLGRVIAVEHPEHWGGLIDLAPLPDRHSEADSAAVAAVAADLVDAIRSAGAEDQLALRDGQRLVPRLVRRAPAAAAAVGWRGDCAYLVTGGLGGLGLRLTEWMAAGGAGTIVLTGRHGLPPRVEWDAVQPGSRAARQVTAIRAAEALGAAVEVVAVDVADVAAMEVLVRRFGTDLPPLAGVVHAAAALGNSSIATMSARDVESMFRPKVAGTLLLHELTRDVPLDFFVMFSSTSALWGSRELGHYAAANQFLDAMAHHRHSLGLPALSVDWGTWDEMRVASAEDRAEVAGAGMHPMPSTDALTVLGDLLGHPELIQVAVAAVDWSVLKPVYEARRPRPFLGAVAAPRGSGRTGRASRQDAPAELVIALTGVTGDARQEVVVDFLRTEVARALGIGEPQAVDVEQGLFEMGMDSLMSVELKGRIETAVGSNLPSTLTFNYPNIVALAGYVVTDVLPAVQPDVLPDVQPDGQPGTATPVPIADPDLHGHSEDELAALLARRLAALQ